MYLNFPSIPRKRLTNSISASATSFKLDDILSWDGTTDLASTDFGTIAYAVFRDDTRIEIMKIDPSTIADASITIDARGLPYQGTINDTEVTARKLEWTSENTIVELGTNPPQLFAQFSTLADNQTYTGIKAFTEATRPLLTADLDTAVDEEFVSYGQLYRTSLVGSVPADETHGGLTVLGTSTEARFGTDTNVIGAVTYSLFVKPSTLATLSHEHKTNYYPYGESISNGDVLYLKTADNKWWKADASASATSDGTFGVAFQDGSADDYKYVLLIGSQCETVSGITTAGLVYLSDTAGEVSNTAGTYKKVIGFSPNGTAMFLYPQLRVEDLAGGSTITTALLEESATFFDNTDISGAEAETLTDGSDAYALHTHSGLVGAGTSANKLFWNFVMSFITGGVDLPWETAPGGTIEYNGFWVEADTGAKVFTQEPLYPIRQFNAAKDIYVENTANLSDASHHLSMGLFGATDPGTTYNQDNQQQVCFTVNGADGKLYAHTSNGYGGTSGAHTETEITGITLTNDNTYRIEWEAGVEARFYVNGTLEATITTGLPNGGDLNNRWISWGALLESGATLIMTEPNFSIEK